MSDLFDVDYWLQEVGRRGWALYAFGQDSRKPDLLAAVWDWETPYTDVVLIHSETRALAWRAPIYGPETNPFAPQWVTWWYGSNAVHTLRAVITMAPPGEEQFKVQVMKAPGTCVVPEEFRRKMTCRPSAGNRPVVVHTP